MFDQPRKPLDLCGRVVRVLLALDHNRHANANLNVEANGDCGADSFLVNAECNIDLSHWGFAFWLFDVDFVWILLEHTFRTMVEKAKV